MSVAEYIVPGMLIGIVILLVGLFTWQHIEHRKSALELKMFQMENTRIVQQLAKSTEEISRTAAQRHEDHMAYFNGMMQSLGRIIRKQEEGEGGGAK